MRNDPFLTTHPTGVAASVAAAARLNENSSNEMLKQFAYVSLEVPSDTYISICRLLGLCCHLQQPPQPWFWESENVCYLPNRCPLPLGGMNMVNKGPRVRTNINVREFVFVAHFCTRVLEFDFDFDFDSSLTPLV